MTDRPSRGALVGCGFFARNHLHAWQGLPGAEIAAVCDLDGAKAAAAAATFGIARTFTDAAAMLDTVRPDFLDIVTTVPGHRSLVDLAAARRVAAICQKPFAETLADAEAMVAACAAAGVPLMVHENFRWQRPFLAPLLAGFAMRDYGVGVAAALAIALAGGALMGAINAFFIVRLRIVPFIVTLSTLFLFRGAGTFLTSSRQLDFPRAILDFGLSRVLGVPLPIVLFLAVALAAHVVLARTAFGRQIYAIGSDREAARKAGIDTGRITALAYVVSGAAAALAGFVLIAQIGRLDQAFGEGREFDVIAAAVLGGASLFGGIGTALGAVVGATFIQTVKTGLVFAGINLYLQPMLLGLIIFLAVFFDSLRDARLLRLKRRYTRPLG